MRMISLMTKFKNILKKFNPDETNLRNARRVILKVVIGFGIIAGLVFIAVNRTHKKLSQLSETVSAILLPNIKLIKLKEISGCLYGAVANVNAYSIRRDTAYLISYKNYINYINTRIDTLVKLSGKGKIIDKNEEKANQNFLAQIDTLRDLMIERIDLFNQYIELKTGESSPDVLLQVLQKIKTKTPAVNIEPAQKAETSKKSFFSRLVSKKNKKDTSNLITHAISSDSVQGNIQKIILQT